MSAAANNAVSGPDGRLWGGRFEEAPADSLWRFTVDTADRRLLAVDVAGSQAHVAMLRDVGLLDAAEHDALRSGLDAIAAEAAAGAFDFEPGDEDVHTAVERRLGELIGPVAGKLHTGRSRNDQVAFDLRLYLASAGRQRIEQLREMIAILADVAEQHADSIVAAYTHLQQAQAVPLGHQFLAYAWMLLRDKERLEQAIVRLEVSPLGAGAGAGSSLPLDPARVAERVGFPRYFDNSIDAVASRDFASEYVFVVAQCMVHLSRLAEELVLWSTSEFGWVTFADSHTTGSSALPHKKNPDIAELVRGKAASVLGDVMALLAVQKGLPLAYNRDLQEDKRSVFHADDTLSLALEALAGMVATATFHPAPPTAWVTALDLAETLVGRGVPFREAHAAVGALATRLVGEGRALDSVTVAELTAAHVGFEPDDLRCIDASGSVAARVSPGGGSPSSVHSQLEQLRTYLA